MENTDAGDPPSYLTYLVSALFSPFSLDLALAATGIILLLLLSALVSGAEAAFFSLSEAELATCRQRPQRSYKRVLDLLQQPRRLLTTMLVIDNIINVALVIIIINLAIQLNGRNLGFSTVLTIAVALTIAISFFGEVLPKIRATRNRLTTACRMAGFLHWSDIILAPISGLLLSLSNLIERKVRAKPNSVRLDELQNAIDASLTTENREEKEILKGIVNFSTTTVKQVMHSRVDVIAFDISTSYADLLPLINQWGYSRVPIYSETVDKIEGILYIKDLLQHLDAGPDFAWQTLLRPPYFVPESKKIDDLLREFQEMHVHMAIVVDEYGGTAGLLTFEDIVEEIVGEIKDEFDEEEDVEYAQIDENTFIFEGQTSLNEFCKVTGIDPEVLELVRKNNESVGGLMLELFSKIPQEGEEIEIDSYKFIIEAADNKRVKQVKVYVGVTK
ncbi:gliding motility-associated protein GldE [Adhaeribacter rhizoryzae]|uniref:gliding motility-associated protein GldE n=1 Tax=Adhaeribacter rhizoryzae TaxID=2607907 RepID=UPI001CC20083|nr:gliding motility-associated protein GldE [Adhaeribacter rhizoryzae]